MLIIFAMWRRLRIGIQTRPDLRNTPEHSILCCFGPFKLASLNPGKTVTIVGMVWLPARGVFK